MYGESLSCLSENHSHCSFVCFFSKKAIFIANSTFTDIDDCVHITPNKEPMFKFAIIYEHHDIYIYVRLHTCEEWAFMLFIYVYARQTLKSILEEKFLLN